MIPKTLHYMWFGGKQMPSICKECIESWHKVLPSDWSFQFWNEDNYDVEINNFVLQAYRSGNYAFVSDYARWDILHRQGGVYVDTDVFLLKDITPLLSNKAFGGQNCSGVFASGLILGAEPNLPICKEIMSEYDRRDFLTKDGKPTFVTNILVENGLLQNKYNFKPDAIEVQTVADITIYPTDYFCPFSPVEGTLKTTANTYAIHQFTGTWMPEERKAAQAKANPKLAEHYKRVK